MIYRFERRARGAQAMAVIAGIWVMLAAGWVFLDVAWWVTAFFAAFTLPALWDMARDRRASVEIWPDRIVWDAAFSKGTSSNIAHVRMNRRFDGSMKILMVHIGGATTRLPPDIAPPPDAFEAALKSAGFAVERHPFSPF